MTPRKIVHNQVRVECASLLSVLLARSQEPEWAWGGDVGVKGA